MKRIVDAALTKTLLTAPMGVRTKRAMFAAIGCSALVTVATLVSEGAEAAPSRTVRSLESSAPSPLASRREKVALVAAPKLVTTVRKAPTAIAVASTKPRVARVSTLVEGATRELCERLRMASFMEGDEPNRGGRSWEKRVAADAKAWRVRFGDYTKAWDKCQDAVKWFGVVIVETKEDTLRRHLRDAGIVQ